MLKMNEERLVEHSASANGAMTSTDLFSLISQVPTTVTDVEPLLEMMRSFDYSITSHLIDELRKKHQVSDYNRTVNKLNISGNFNDGKWFVMIKYYAMK